MELQIITPDEEKRFSVDWLEIETPEGNFIIHSGHAPTLLTLLSNHDIVFKLKSGKQESMRIVSGIVDITRERATVIVNE